MMLAPKSEPAAERFHSDLIQSAADLAKRASIETSTRNLAEIDACSSLLARGTDVYIAWVPGSPYRHIVGVAKRLRQAGMNPVPHIAARQLGQRRVAADFLAGLRDEAQVTRALLIGGDSDRPAGVYESSAALLETGLLQQHGISSVGIAGYPEGHPRISDGALMAALDRKISYAAMQGLNLFLVTQFCFEGPPILEWLRRLRGRGTVLPVRVGVAGPATIRALLNYGLRCGIGNSMRALGSQAISLTRLLAQQGPEAVVGHIAREAAELNVTGLHLFPFGGFARSAQWIDNVAGGGIRFAESDSDSGI
ncbi:MAG: hypothetical protein A3G25_04820 [Betaproteobacteria bacterium RIFCSPLOWO2_12_FULL_63_13]|nr:MAG: hypothetical protein A3G25_04820 [Betaproteobacteria bacterium RIFCSPLOWO2_12_FULL_63_13]